MVLRMLMQRIMFVEANLQCYLSFDTLLARPLHIHSFGATYFAINLMYVYIVIAPLSHTCGVHNYDFFIQ